MAINFKTLYLELNLPAHYEGEASKLNALEDWCFNTISQDVRFEEGKDKANYSHYLALAKAYLDEFLAHLPNHFKETNPIRYAAQKGYDRFLSAQTDLPIALLNEGDVYGMTPLHKAAISCKTK